MQFFKQTKNKAEKKTCSRVEFGPSKIDGHSMGTVLLFSQCTRYVQHYTGQFQYLEHQLEMKIYLRYRG